MKTTFHGSNINSLYDIGFNPIVPKYADNGRVFSKDDYTKYMQEYRLRSEGEWLRNILKELQVNYLENMFTMIQFYTILEENHIINFVNIFNHTNII